MKAVSRSGVAILLCTYQGKRYLAEQLDSFEAQTYPQWHLWVSDDGSSDGTQGIIDAYRSKWGPDRLVSVSGPSEGLVRNFLSLLCNESLDSRYYAYSDQDDIWEADKLERAVQWLETVPADVPALYCSRTRLVDAANHEIGLSPLFDRAPAFGNALVENIGGGNTMVFNDTLRKLLRLAGERVPIVLHDWWTYLVATGCGGMVYYDTYPSLRYRQHGGNVIGMNRGWYARLRRLKKLWQGEYRRWADGNLSSLVLLEGYLASGNRQVLKNYMELRSSSIIRRIIALQQTRISRQTMLGNISFAVGVLLKRL